MNSVFIAGSRAVSRLNKDITERVENITRQGLTVLVGDANGADKAVQYYLSEHRYPNVLVYCMEDCRNNLGGWPTRHNSAAPGVKHDRHYYGIKDLAMAKDANYGFMLWDSRSKGTLTNMFNLLSADKKVLLYITPKRSFFTLSTFSDLSDALHTIGIRDTSEFLNSLGLSPQAAFALTSAHLPR